MKLFQSLLVAPATLGLLAPIAATANEVTINDFNAAEEIAVTNSRVDCLEARFNNLEAGSFSETTQHLSVLILLLLLPMEEMRQQHLVTKWVLA